MPLDKVDAWMGAAIAGVAATWRIVVMFFDLRSKVDKHAQRLDHLEEDVGNRFREVREDIRKVGEQTEKRHTRIEDKLDKLIDRELNGG